MNETKIRALAQHVLEKMEGKIDGYYPVAILAPSHELAQHVFDHNHAEHNIGSFVLEKFGFQRTQDMVEPEHIYSARKSGGSGNLYFVRTSLTPSDFQKRLDALKARMKRVDAALSNPSGSERVRWFSREIDRLKSEQGQLRTFLFGRRGRKKRIEELEKEKENAKRFIIGKMRVASRQVHSENELYRHLQTKHRGQEIHALFGIGLDVSDNPDDRRIEDEAIELFGDKDTMDSVVELIKQEPKSIPALLRIIHRGTKFILPCKESPEAIIYERAKFDPKIHERDMAKNRAPFSKVKKVNIIDQA